MIGVDFGFWIVQNSHARAPCEAVAEEPGRAKENSPTIQRPSGSLVVWEERIFEIHASRLSAPKRGESLLATGVNPRCYTHLLEIWAVSAMIGDLS
jgi:hypothetical protein